MAPHAAGSGRTIGPVLVALVVLGAGLRLFRLGTQPLWLDEAYTWDATRIVGREGPLAVASFDHISPLYYWLAWASTSVGHLDAFWLRLPSALAGIAAIPLVFLVTRRLLGSHRVALAAAALMAASPTAVWYSQEARTYTLVMTLGLIYVWLCFRALDERRTSVATWAGICAVTTVALWSHHVFVFLMAALGAYALLRSDWRGRPLVGWVASQALAVLAFLPWVFLTADRLGKSVGALKPDAALWVPYSYLTFLAGTTVGPDNRQLRTEGAVHGLTSHPGALALFAVVGVLVLVGAARQLPRFGWRPTVWVVVWGVLPVVFLLVATYVVHIGYNPRYVMTALPAVLVVVAVACAGGGNRLRAGTTTVLVAVLFGWSLANWFLDPTYAKDDLRSAETTLAREMRPGDTLVIANSSAIPPLEVYGFTCPDHAVVVRDARAADTLSRGSTGSGRTFVLETRQWEVLDDADLDAATAGLGAVDREWTWPGVTLAVHGRALQPTTGPGLDAGCGR